MNESPTTAAIRSALGVLFADGGCWTEADTAAIIIDADGRFATVATFGSDHGVATLTEDGVRIVFDDDEPDMIKVVIASIGADGEWYLQYTEPDAPGSAAGTRAEADTCERGTPGCSVLHTTDSECATW